MDKRLSGCTPDILQQDAANESLRSLWEHIHHQQECYENISLIVGIKHSGIIIFNLYIKCKAFRRHCELNWSTVLALK